MLEIIKTEIKMSNDKSGLMIEILDNIYKNNWNKYSQNYCV